MSAPAVMLSYPVVPDLDAWIVPEGKVSEAPVHDLVARHVDAVLRAHLARIGIEGSVHRNLALHWRQEKPRSGVDPDVTLVCPPILVAWGSTPPGLPRIPVAPRSLKLWLSDTPRPILAIEVVSTTHPNKDYGKLHERYADLRIPELWVLDPRLQGPRALGGPVPLQQWLSNAHGFERVYFGAGAFHSPTLGLWVRALAESPGVAFSRDEAGEEPVLDERQAALAERDAERSRADAERARADELAAEVEQLRAMRREP